jgi:hypothetical protein
MRFDLEHAATVLSRTPTIVRGLLGGLPADWVDRPYGPPPQNTWTAKEVVAHLVFGERTDWLPRLRIILEYGESKPFDRFDRSGHSEMHQSSTLAQLLDLFDAERRKSLIALRSLRLTEADLAKRGRHPALGVVTVENLLATWVVHDLNHIAQICKAMAWQHETEVGPWERYLSILAPPNPR